MGEATLTVPAEHVEALRRNLFGALAGDADCLEKAAEALAFPDGEHAVKMGVVGPPHEDEAAGRCAVDTYVSTENIAAWSQMLGQLAWTDRIGDSSYELSADPERVARVLTGALTDAGVDLHRVTERVPFDRAAFDRVKHRAEWLADRLGELEPVAA